MKITSEMLMPFNPCDDGLKWFEGLKVKTPKGALKAAGKDEIKLGWCNWGIARLLNKENGIRYAIYAARKVLHIYEEKYPKDDRPRKAIEAAEKYLNEPKDVYLCDLDSPEYKEHYAENRYRQERAGLRKNIKNPDFCPALVAESLARQTKRLVVEIGADFIGRPELTPDKLINSGMANYDKFVDLCCKLIVNEPGYKNPLPV